MRYRSFAAGILAGTAALSGAAADPWSKLAADDPSAKSGWHLPPRPTAGARAITPVEAKDWLSRSAGGPQSQMPGMDMARPGDTR